MAARKDSPLRNITRETLAPLWARLDIPTARIAAHLGVTRAGLSLHAKKLGLPSRAGNKAHEKHRSETYLRKLWMAGLPTQRIAEVTGYAHRSGVSACARRMGLPPRANGNASGFYGPDGHWQPHTPITNIMQDELARAMAREGKRKGAK